MSYFGLRSWPIAALLVLAAQSASAQTLPLKRLRLYETGVGYFERTGSLKNRATAELPVPAGHLDDALKTLVVLGDGGKASVQGVEFSSSVSRGMARALAGLPSEGDSRVEHADLLRSLRGAPVEVRTRTETVRGRVVDLVESKESELEECVGRTEKPADAKDAASSSPCVLRQRSALLLLTERDEVRRFRVIDVVSIRPTDPAGAGRLRSALDATSQRGAQARRTLGVLAANSAPITLAYVAESPIWRSTYRLLLDTRDEGLLQGWALVHNDTDEDWSRVELELVNGRPDSFLYPLAAPRYARRKLETPADELYTVPQLLDTTVDNLWGDEIGDSFGAGGLGLSGTGEGGGGRGEGIGLGSIGTVGHGGGAGSSSLLSVGNLAAIAKADGVEAGALFRYTIATPVDLRAHGSALLPFAAERIRSRRIAWFGAPGDTAQSAVHFRNATRQTLPAGPVAVFADGGFAGETQLERLKPGEGSILRFGSDQDVEIDELTQRHQDAPEFFALEGDRLVEHFRRKTQLRYELTNRSGSGRTLYLALGVVDNARLSGADGVEYDAARKKPLLVFELGAHARKLRDVAAEEGLRRDHPLDKLSSTKLRELAASPPLQARQRALLLRAAERLIEAEVREGALGKRSAERRQTQQDILRMRENVRAFGAQRGSASERLAARLLAEEERATALSVRIAELKAESREKRQAARQVLAELTKPVSQTRSR